jgi:hypothetical protein
MQTLAAAYFPFLDRSMKSTTVAPGEESALMTMTRREPG